MSNSQCDAMIQFLNGLRSRNERAPIAHLRRSLAFPPGQYVPAYPYVQRFATGAFSEWQTKVTYLIAGLWALSRSSNSSKGNFGFSTKQLAAASKSGSIEHRFLALLEADPDQLPHHLRQFTALMSSHDIAPDWSRLCNDLRWWQHPDRGVQQQWASSFYYEAPPKADENETTDTDSASGKENT